MVTALWSGGGECSEALERGARAVRSAPCSKVLVQRCAVLCVCDARRAAGRVSCAVERSAASAAVCMRLSLYLSAPITARLAVHWTRQQLCDMHTRSSGGAPRSNRRLPTAQCSPQPSDSTGGIRTQSARRLAAVTRMCHYTAAPPRESRGTASTIIELVHPAADQRLAAHTTRSAARRRAALTSCGARPGANRDGQRCTHSLPAHALSAHRQPFSLCVQHGAGFLFRLHALRAASARHGAL